MWTFLAEGPIKPGLARDLFDRVLTGVFISMKIAGEIKAGKALIEFKKQITKADLLLFLSNNSFCPKGLLSLKEEV